MLHLRVHYPQKYKDTKPVFEVKNLLFASIIIPNTSQQDTDW